METRPVTSTPDAAPDQPAAVAPPGGDAFAVATEPLVADPDILAPRLALSLHDGALTGLARDFLVSGSLKHALDHPRYLEGEAWAQLRESCDDLPLDVYMRDGGRYRRRRLSRLQFDVAGNVLRAAPPRAYNQSSAINYLNGDIDRHYEPLVPAVYHNPLLDALLRAFGRALAVVDGVDRWQVNVHQARITATPHDIGKPVPEGVHRDGTRYSLLLMLNRINVDGGHSIVHDNDKRPVFERTMTDPGDFIILLDPLTYHDVTPITPADGVNPAFRDMLVVEFNHLDGPQDGAGRLPGAPHQPHAAPPR